MIRIALIVSFCLGTIVVAWGQIAGIGSNQGPRFNRHDLLGMGLGATLSTGGGPPPPSCDGTINLSTGCVQPMLRGL